MQDEHREPSTTHDEHRETSTMHDDRRVASAMCDEHGEMSSTGGGKSGMGQMGDTNQKEIPAGREDDQTVSEDL